MSSKPPDELSPGVPPVPSAVSELDWSGSAADAAVGQLLEAAADVDRSAARLVETLIGVIESGASEESLGVAVEMVLSQSARIVKFERNTLTRAATTLAKMPATRDAYRQGWISLSQVKAIVTAVNRVNVAGRDQVDDLVAEHAYDYRDYEADALVAEVDWLVDQLLAQREADKQSQPVETNRLVSKQRLDGSGTFYGEYDADHFPLVSQAIDNLADDRFPFENEPDLPDNDTARDMSDAALSDAWRNYWKVRGRNATRRAKACFELLTGRDHDTLAPLDPEATGRSTGRPAVLLTCGVDTLLDGTTPAFVLNRLGGRITVTAETARRWLDVAGADAQLFLYDECGETVGYGRRRRHADGWLRDAIIARDLHDTGPCSTTPGVVCDVDHVVDWTDGGRTDVDNLTLLSRRFNNAKSRGDWTLTRHPDGSRTWTARSGYTIRQPRPPHLPRRPDPPGPPDPDCGPSP